MDAVIDSPTNPLIKHLVGLQRASGRRKHARFVVEGRRAIDGMLAQGWVPERLVLLDSLDRPASWPGDALTWVTGRALARASSQTTPSGYLAEFILPDNAAIDPVVGGLVLVGVRDPGNLGTLLRTAVAVGLPQVVIADGADPFSPKAVQASAGCLAGVTLATCEDACTALHMTAEGAPRLALVARNGAPMPRAQAAWVVVGGEANGLDASTVADCEQAVTLAMPGGAESLNAAIAGAIACYLVAVG